MRWTQYFIPTSKEVPRDATAASHQLMLRSGMTRQLAAGVYSYLPLGYRTLRKVEAIVREEMERAGALELHMPVLQPIDLWQETNRVAAMGDTLLRLRPVRSGDASDWREHTVLGPTHEEVVTEIARGYLSSYKQLPVNLYQIQTKFRGEARPKSGVLRTREFLMKDAYSFDADKAGLDASYQRMYDAYCRIFSRCGLPYVAVEADSGAIGGDVSHEFMVLTDAGEDTVAISEAGKYAANTERATCRPLAAQSDSPQSLREVHTPGAGRVEDVCRMMGTTPAQMIKTLIFTARVPAPGGAKGGEVEVRVVALVRGDHEINEIKLRKACGAAVELAAPAVIEKLTGAAVGFAGPQGLAERLGAGDMLVIDRDVATMRNAASGANRTDHHVVGVNPGRDFPIETPAGAACRVAVADIRMVCDGDISPDGSPIRLRTAIEVGHVFKLGTKYSDAMKATFLGREGKPQSLVMGCYGIGLNRIVAAAIEAHHDDAGACWPVSIAPFEAVVISLDPRDAEVSAAAERAYEALRSEGVDVLYDDRDERAGFKFKDADLVGFPLRLVVGRKSLAEGVVEFSERRDPAQKHALSPQDAVARVITRVRELRGGAGSRS
ncbi:MAG: proline--tRNA ligase [Planctomycetia bacterium]|nr:MAG: proline--tRNA ligase [Planctomycetia bacterium]